MIVIVFTSVLGAFIWISAGIIHYQNQSGVRKITTCLQVFLLAIAIVNVMIVSNTIENKQGLSSINKIVSWTTSSNSNININLF